MSFLVFVCSHCVNLMGGCLGRWVSGLKGGSDDGMVDYHMGVLVGRQAGSWVNSLSLQWQ